MTLYQLSYVRTPTDNTNGLMPPTRPEAIVPPRRRRQLLDLLELDVHHWHYNELGDPLAALDGDGLLSVVDEDDPELAAIAGVDDSGAVGDTDAVAKRQARAWRHQADVAIGYGNRNSGADRGPAFAWDLRRLRGAQIDARIAGVGALGQGKL